MTTNQAHLDYVLRLGDNALILAQRISAWTGHGPVLEQDIAMSNVALDLLGQAQNLLEHAASLQGLGKSADDLAFLRDGLDFRNEQIVELPNGDWGQTTLRQFLYDVYNFYNYQALCESSDKQLAAIAEKSLKEVTYHLRYSSEWTIRLGDGTEESRNRMLAALEYLWPYTGALLTPNAVDAQLVAEGIAPDLEAIKSLWREKVHEVLQEATLDVPPFDAWMHTGGKDGQHTEHLGYILAEMQHIQRTYPNLSW